MDCDSKTLCFRADFKMREVKTPVHNLLVQAVIFYYGVQMSHSEEHNPSDDLHCDTLQQHNGTHPLQPIANGCQVPMLTHS